jgi:tetratricopeptide (TPR) repeat protein
MLQSWYRTFLLVPTAVLLLVGAGCFRVYTPNESVVQKMSPAEARETLKRMVGLYYVKHGNNFISKVDKVVTSKKNKIIFFLKNGDSYSVELRLQDIREESIKIGGTSSEIIRINNDEFWTFDRQLSKNLVVAIYVLKRAAIAEGNQSKLNEAKFEEAVKLYRNSTNKPMLSEDVRKFKVQAESAVRDRSFDDAAGFYEEALNLAPWWPEGHFNRALVLSEGGEFETAILEMKRYIRLAPDAPNARAAQDKIYEWERKVGK